MGMTSFSSVPLFRGRFGILCAFRPDSFPGYELFLYVTYILNYTVRLYSLSNKVFMNKLYKTAKMSHNARFALQDIFARLEDYMERKRKEEMFIENAG